MKSQMTSRERVPNCMTRAGSSGKERFLGVGRSPRREQSEISNSQHTPSNGPYATSCAFFPPLLFNKRPKTGGALGLNGEYHHARHRNASQT